MVHRSQEVTLPGLSLNSVKRDTQVAPDDINLQVKNVQLAAAQPIT